MKRVISFLLVVMFTFSMCNIASPIKTIAEELGDAISELLEDFAFGTLTGKVTDANGKGAENVAVWIYNYDESCVLDMVYTNSEGVWQSEEYDVIVGYKYKVNYYLPAHTFSDNGIIVTSKVSETKLGTVTATPISDAVCTISDFEYEIYNDEVTITKYTGSDKKVIIPDEIEGLKVTTIGYRAFYNSTVTDVFSGCNIKTVDDNAFNGCTSLKNITFPEGLERIDNHTFYNCTSLEEITLPDSVTTIEYNAFYNCSSLKKVNIPLCIDYAGSNIFKGCTLLTNMEVPEGIINLPGNIFNGMSSLKTVLLPEGLVEIGGSVFSNCTGLEEVTIPSSVTRIDDNVFSNCTSLKSITLSEGLEYIGHYAFYNCTSLEEITLPDSVKTIEYNAFYNCSNLKKINIPLCIDYAGSNIFKGCTLLTSIEVPEGIISLPGNIFNGMESLKTISFPDSLVEIGGSAFYHCTSLESVTLPEGLKEIGDSAFSDCKNLKSITLPDGLEYIGHHAFYNCASLEEVVLPDSVKTIEYNAFYNCSNLKKINIPLSIEYTSHQIFKGCPLLTHMEVPEGITILPGNIFNGMDSLKTISLPEGLIEIGGSAFYNCTALEEVNLPDSLEKIGDSAFSCCTKLKNLNIPDTVHTIENNAFYNCTSLKKINIPVSITEASYNIFSGCSALTSIAVPEGITHLPAQMFYNATYLKTVKLPESLVEIGESAFSNCKSLEKVWIGENVTYIDDYAFYNVPAEFTIHGVKGSYAEEFAVEKGYFFSTEALDYVEVALSGSVTDENGNGIEGVTVTIYDKTNKKYLPAILTDASGEWICESLKAEVDISVIYYKSGYEFTISKFNLTTAQGETTLDNSVATFTEGAVCVEADFEYEIYNNEVTITKYAGSDTKVIIPETIEGLNVTAIGYRAFAGTTVTDVFLGSGVKTIDDNAFINCKSLKNITFPEGLDKIDNHAFYNCTALEEVTLPDSVKTIEYNAFYNCPGLKKVNIPLCIDYTGSNIFKGCTLLTSMEVPEGITILPGNIFNGMSSLKTISLPDTLVEIGGSAFNNCTALEEVVLPHSLKELGDNAFSNCKNLKSITLPDGLEYIGHHAFYNCTSLEEVEIPDNVKTIEYNAFYNCSLLKTVNIPLNIEYTGYQIFKGCPLLTSMEVPEGITILPGNIFNGMDSLKTISLPEGLIEIGDSAFNNCTALEEIKLPDSLEKICSGAFAGCKLLKSITLPDAVKEIENNAFLNCSSLKRINIPVSIEYASYNIFSGCSALTSIAVPEGITHLPAQMFYNATYLKTVKLPESLVEIGESAFSNCKSLEKVWIGKSVTCIDDYAFYNVPAEFTIHGVKGSYAEEFAIEKGYFFSTEALDYVEVYLSGSVTDKNGNGVEGVTVTIYDNTNKKYLPTITTDSSGEWICESLKAGTAISVSYYKSGYEFTISKFKLTTTQGETTLDNSVAAFTEGAVCVEADFEYEIYNNEVTITKYTGSDKKVIIPDEIEGLKVTTIGYRAFYNSTVTDVFSGGNVKNIDDNAFINCTSLKNITFPEGLDKIDNHAFYNCTALEEVSLPDSVKTIEYNAFYNCSNLKKVNIPLHIDYTGSNIFKGCPLLTSMEVPEGLTILPGNIFNGMSSLKTVSFPDTLLEIGGSAFYNCSGLESVTLPEGLKEIGDSAFSTCKNLKSITLPDGLEYIGHHAFYNCTSLEEVEIPDSVKTIEYNAFYNCSLLKTVNIPLNIEYTGYQIFKGCPLLTSMEVPVGITILPGNIFNGMDSLKTISLPEGLIEIGGSAFYNCTALEEIKLPDSLEKIDDSAFSRCTNLKALDIPNSVKEIGFHAFYDCSSLTSFTYPVSLQHAGHDMFAGCTALEEVIIPEGVTKIADNTFSNLPNLKTISLPESLEEIGSNAFGSCDNLRFVIVPNNVSRIGSSAFSNCDNLRYVTIGALKCEMEASIFHGSEKTFIYCQPVSDAARYAIENNLPFTPISSDGNDYTDYITDMSSTRFYSDKTLVLVDSYIPVTLDYTFHEDKFNAVSDATISILFSKNVEVMENRIELNDEAITDFTYDDIGGVLTIPVEKSSGKLRFYVSVWDHGTVSALASLNYYSKGWQNENIALVYLDAPAIKFDAPATVSSGNLTITGITEKSKKILFTINGVDAGNTAARKDGTFTYKLNLPTAEKEGEKFNIRATLAEDATKYYEQSVSYETGAPLLTKFLMRYSSDITVPYVNLLDETQRLTLRFNPSDGFRFEIKFDNPEKLGTVFVGSSKNGKLSKLYAVPVGEGGEYVAEGFFDNDPNFLPGAINVYYNTYSDPNDYATPLAKEDLPEVWKNAENEVVEQTKDVYRSHITLESGEELEYSVHENLTLAQARHLILGEPLPASEDESPELFANATAAELVFGFFDDIVINFTKEGVSTATRLDTTESGDMAMMIVDEPGSTFWQIVWDNSKEAFSAAAINFAGTAAIQYFSPGVSWSNCGSAFGLISDTAGVLFHVYDDMVSVDDALNDIKSSTTLTAEQKNYATQKVEGMKGAYLALNAFRFIGAVTSYGLTLTYGPIVGALAGMIFDGVANIIEGYLDGAMAYYAAGGQGSYLKWLIDPSGYVYDAITNKRLKGATTWVYCILFEEDDDATFWDNIPSPDEYGTLWQAEEYSQQNPLTTDEEGKYAWDVPEGWWRVKCEMDGYETVWSDWLPVPPVQTEVNLAMFPTAMPEEYYYFDTSSKTVVISSKLKADCTVAVAAYTDDALTSVEIKENVTLTGSVTNVTMDKVITDGADNIKVFIWKDKASMLPLVNQMQ